MPLQSCCCPLQKNLPRKAELAWLVSRYLWRGTWNFKIIFSRPLFTIILSKNVSFKTRDFRLLIYLSSCCGLSMWKFPAQIYLLTSLQMTEIWHSFHIFFNFFSQSHYQRGWEPDPNPWFQGYHSRAAQWVPRLLQSLWQVQIWSLGSRWVQVMPYFSWLLCGSR